MHHYSQQQPTSSRWSTKQVLEWITTICSTLSLIGIAFLIKNSSYHNNNVTTTYNNPVATTIDSQDTLSLPQTPDINSYPHHDMQTIGTTISSETGATRVGMLNGATILVTGAGSGIGMATAHAVLRECGNVILLGRNETKISNVYKNLTNNYLPIVNNYCNINMNSDGINSNQVPRIFSVIADIRNITQLRSAMSQISNNFSKLDGCANIAGISGPIDYIDSVNMDDWLFSDNDPILNNLYGTIQSIRAEIELLKVFGQKSGVIVNAGSTNSFTGCAQCALYVSSKYGIKGVTKSVALSYAYPSESNGNLTLRVNAVAPGMIDTPLTRNQGRIYEGLQPFECYDKNGQVTDYGCPDISEDDPLYIRLKDDLIDSGSIPINRIIAPQEIANVVVFLLSNYSSAVTGDVWLADGGVTAM